MKKAICVGINNYQGTANDLNGCINDVNDWSTLLESFGFETAKILDDQATKSNILTAFENIVTVASAGDVIVFTYSGHGTQVLDTSGDEQDSYDEAFYVYDGPIVDDELRVILSKTNKDATIVIICDSCFSGTVTKAATKVSIKPRFHKTDQIPANAIPKRRFLAKSSDEEMIEVLLSACSDEEYSYDANINGKWNGAFTAFTIPLIEPEQTYNELFTKIKTKLPTPDYPQTPQLEGSETNKNRLIFTEKTDSGTGNGGTGGNSGCFSAILTLVALAAVVVLSLLISH